MTTEHSSFSMTTEVSRCQDVSILDFTGAKDDGGGNVKMSCRMYKGPVKSSFIITPKAAHNI